MLKSCKYCGRIHDEKNECEQKLKEKRIHWENRKKSRAYIFRKTNAWTVKSREVRQRDRYTCLCCLNDQPGTIDRYNSRNLSVHHITPIEEDYELRLDEANLITVCEHHHQMCEDGTISREIQRRFVMESIGRYD